MPRFFRSSRWRWVAAGAVIAGLALVWQYGICIWYAPPFSARVVDGQGRPVAGAIVDVSWDRRLPFTGASPGVVAIQETVTDQAGGFRVPGWGPRLFWQGAVSDDQPVLRVFKQGYAPVVARNIVGLSRTSAPAIIHARLQNAAISLQALRGTLAANRPLFFTLVESIKFDDSVNRCAWTQMPRLRVELGQIEREFDAVTSEHVLSGFAGGQHQRDAECGAPHG